MNDSIDAQAEFTYLDHLATVGIRARIPTSDPVGSIREWGREWQEPLVTTDAAGVVVVLTALDMEYDAVRALLRDPTRHPHPAGTIFEVGRLDGVSGKIALAEIGPGNQPAAALTERAITEFRPRAVLFVGIAGALHSDLELGSVVVGTKVYGYHGGTDETDRTRTHPQAWDADHTLDQLARVVKRTGSWTRQPPAVHFRPVAAGEIVLNSRQTPLAQQLRTTYADAAAIEMESAGSAKAAQLNRVPFLTIRGISDKADGTKYDTDAGWQPVAATNAATFAIAVARSIMATDVPTPAPMDRPTHTPRKVAAPPPRTWTLLRTPIEVVWRRELTGHQARNIAFEMHLTPLAGRLEVRELRRLETQLPACGRRWNLFSGTEEVHTDPTNQAAMATSTDSRTGLAVRRNGQRSVWFPLPGQSTFGPDLVDRVSYCLRLLVDFHLPAPEAVVPTVGIDYEGQYLRIPAEEFVPFRALVDKTADIADELAARVRASVWQ
jgi:nucleoside phosphorylase